MSGDCACKNTSTSQLSASNQYSFFVYPILRITSRAICSAFTVPFDFTSHAITTLCVVTKVSQATLEFRSCAKYASKIASEIWSATLSGCPAETDSEVNK